MHRGKLINGDIKRDCDREHLLFWCILCAPSDTKTSWRTYSMKKNPITWRACASAPRWCCSDS